MTLQHVLSQLENRQSMYESAIRQLPLALLPGLQGNGIPEFVSEKERPLLHEAVRSILPILSNNPYQYHLSGRWISVSKKRIAVLFSGGPASGGHNVLIGLLDCLSGHELWGVRRGPKGLLAGDLVRIDSSMRDEWVNTGGFDWLGSDRTKIKTPEQINQVRGVIVAHQLNGIIIIGGDDSNTNAAFLAEAVSDLGCAVIGVPKTIDGDLQVGQDVPISFGFDTATKIYAELVGNILQDARSSGKYWHVVKLMGRSASHVALEVALQTHPPITLISEEVAHHGWRLSELVNRVVRQIIRRAEHGFHYGVMVIPEGLIEAIAELRDLVAAINHMMVKQAEEFQPLDAIMRYDRAMEYLDTSQRQTLSLLPAGIAHSFFKDRDSHGNLQLSHIPTESLLISLIEKELTQHSLPNGFVFQPIHHFFGYEGRCGAPTRFDATYCYNLGWVAGALALNGVTGMMAAVGQFQQGWQAMGIPLVSMISPENRGGGVSWVIEKTLVDLTSPAFAYFKLARDRWCDTDLFSSPGPRQLMGDLAMQYPISVALNQGLSSLNWEVPTCVSG